MRFQNLTPAETIEYALLCATQPYGNLFALAWDSWASGHMKPAIRTIGLAHGPQGRYVQIGDCGCLIGAALLDCPIVGDKATIHGAGAMEPSEWLRRAPAGVKIGLAYGFDGVPFSPLCDPSAYAFGARVRMLVESVAGPLGPTGPLNASG